jgi:hypothetical protein
MTDLQTDELGPGHQTPRHQTDEAATTGSSAQYQVLVQALDEYAALLNCLLSVLGEARSTSNQA